MKRGGRRLAATLTALALALSAAPALAGSFQINPVNIELSPNVSSTSVTLRNVESSPVSIRVAAFKWTQVNGEDVHTPTKDVIISPPIFTIPAGGTQLVRIGTRTRTPGAAYRVIFEEIPNKALETTGIQVALKLNLPLYILDEQGEADVRWSLRRTSTGGGILVARNEGTRHLQVTEISTVDGQNRKLTLANRMGVVLPNSSKHWEVDLKDSVPLGASLPLTVQTPHGESKIDAVVETP